MKVKCELCDKTSDDWVINKMRLPVLYYAFNEGVDKVGLRKINICDECLLKCTNIKYLPPNIKRLKKDTEEYDRLILWVNRYLAKDNVKTEDRVKNNGKDKAKIKQRKSFMYD